MLSSGGSFADSCLALASHDAPSGKAVVARVEKQTGEPPFSPTAAIRKFAAILRDYGLSRVNGDHWGGNQTRSDWEAEGISYETHMVSASDLYERLEPKIDAQTVAFVDVPKLRQQLLSVVCRNGKIQPRDGQSLDDPKLLWFSKMMRRGPSIKPMAPPAHANERPTFNLAALHRHG